MELKDIGRTIQSTEAMPQPATPEKNKKIYPTMFVDNAPDELSTKPVGHTCRLTVLAKVKSVRETEEGNSVELEIQKIGYASAGQKTKDEYLGMKKEEREEYDKNQVVETQEEENDESESEGD